MRKFFLTKDQKEYIIANYSRETNRSIANKLGITVDQVHSYASNKKLVKEITGCYQRKHYFETCLEKRNNKEYNVYNFLGKEQEPKIEQQFLFKSKYGKYFVNQDYFSVIDNEWKAYWLGFLYADGSVRKVKKHKAKEENVLGVSLSAVDEDHLLKFKESIQSTSPIKLKKTNYKDYMCVKFTVCNKKIIDDLIDKGCYPRKTFLLKPPGEEKVPRYLLRHFIRGFFDGDGCIHVNIEKRQSCISFTGTKEMLEFVRGVFIEEANGTKVSVICKKKNNVYVLQYSNIYVIENIYNFLYKESNIFLQRKLEKFDKLYSLA